MPISCTKWDRVCKFLQLISKKVNREVIRLDYNITTRKLWEIFRKQYMEVLYEVLPKDKKFIENPNYVEFSVVHEEYQYIFDNEYFYNDRELLEYIYKNYYTFWSEFVLTQKLVKSKALIRKTWTINLVDLDYIVEKELAEEGINITK